MPSNALSFAFKRRFSPLDKLRLNSNKISHNSKGESMHKCLQILKLAIQLNVEFVKVDFELSPDAINEFMQRRENSKIIVSTYLKSGVHCKEKLGNLLVGLQSTGPDVIKVVTDVAYIIDVAPVFHVLTHSQGPCDCKRCWRYRPYKPILGAQIWCLYGLWFVRWKIHTRLATSSQPQECI